MYFQKFPITAYSLDDRESVQLVTNFLLRVVPSEELKNNFSAFYTYNIKDGETPEILSFKIYGDTNLHWVILQMNDILDPRFEWPLDNFNLQKVVEGKYGSINAIHHYEDGSGNVFNANVNLTSSAEYSGFYVGNVVVNTSNTGTAFVNSKESSSSINITVTSGGFQSGDVMKIADSTTTANVATATALSGVAVTNFIYEEKINDARREIKILKPQFVERLIREFDSKLKQING